MITIYRLHCPFNNKSYIGQTSKKLRERTGRGSGYHRNVVLYNDIVFFGWDNFIVSILTTCETQEAADIYEDYYINFYDSINHGYNIIMGGKDAFIKLYKREKQPNKEKKVDLYCKISKSGRFYWRVY